MNYHRSYQLKIYCIRKNSDWKGTSLAKVREAVKRREASMDWRSTEIIIIIAISISAYFASTAFDNGNETTATSFSPIPHTNSHSPAFTDRSQRFWRPQQGPTKEPLGSFEYSLTWPCSAPYYCLIVCESERHYSSGWRKENNYAAKVKVGISLVGAF